MSIYKGYNNKNMNDNTKKKLKLFAHNNNWTTSHPLDMERFYQFIIEAYRTGDINIARDEFLEVIEPIHKMDDEELSEWMIKYEQGIELLKVYNNK